MSHDQDAAARATVDAFLRALEGDTRRLSDDEWGLSVEAGGWPLHVGLALRDGMLRVQAAVAEPGALDALDLLRRNRRLPHVRFTATRAGEVWVEADVPAAAVTPDRLDLILGLLVERAGDVRRDRSV